MLERSGERCVLCGEGEGSRVRAGGLVPPRLCIARPPVETSALVCVLVINRAIKASRLGLESLIGSE